MTKRIKFSRYEWTYFDYKVAVPADWEPTEENIENLMDENLDIIKYVPHPYPDDREEITDASEIELMSDDEEIPAPWRQEWESNEQDYEKFVQFKRREKMVWDYQGEIDEDWAYHKDGWRNPYPDDDDSWEELSRQPDMGSFDGADQIEDVRVINSPKKTQKKAKDQGLSR